MPDDMDSALADRLHRVRDRIGGACARAGRDPAQVTIIAVTKRHPLPTLQQLLDAGLPDLGENRVQEGLQKLPGLPDHARVHLIGQLQSNKVNKAVGAFASIQSVDRGSLLRRIDRRAQELGVVQPVWIQANISGEEQKGGCGLERLGELWAQALEAPGVEPLGTMAMAEDSPDEARVRGQFARLREASAGLRRADGAPARLSMGMSGDFEWALLEGATDLRLGTVLLGPRPA